MLNRMFPRQIDNQFRGHKLGLWLFYPITFLNLVIDLVAIFSRDSGAQSADGIPLDTFGAGGAQAVIFVVALLGLSGLLLAFLFVLALFRYRAMVPLMYALLVLEFLGHKGIAFLKPVARASAPSASFVPWGLFTLTVIGLTLSLLGKGYRSRPESECT